jgi:hypothetical protein
MNGEQQAAELAKEGVKQLLEPVKDVMRRLLGPAATEIGLAWGDSFRVWRLKRVVRLLEEVEHLAADNGVQLKPVAPRLLFPILEAASLQDDEELYNRWIALLTNFASDHDSSLLPSFPETLRQLTPEEARFLDKAYDDVEDAHRETPPRLERISGELLKSTSQVMMDDLERLQLVTRNSVLVTGGDEGINIFPAGNHLHLSELGKAFIRACRAPKPAGA